MRSYHEHIFRKFSPTKSSVNFRCIMHGQISHKQYWPTQKDYAFRFTNNINLVSFFYVQVPCAFEKKILKGAYSKKQFQKNSNKCMMLRSHEAKNSEVD